MNWADVLFNALASGDVYGAVISSYTNVLGNFFYLSLLFLAMVMIYLKTQNFVTTTLVGILLSAFIAVFVPPITFTAIVVAVALGITLILYRVFR